MIYEITHETNYYYSSNVSLCHNLAHLTARDCPWQTCLSHELQISSPPAVSINRTDYFGNLATFFTVQEPHRRLEITAINRVEVHPRAIPDPAATPPWEEVDAGRSGPARAPRHSTPSICVRLALRQARSRAAGLCRPVLSRPVVRLLEAVLDLTRRIFTEFRFDSSARNFDTPLTRTARRSARGVCQDFSHLQIGCLRTLGLAARYVSGYLLTTPRRDRDAPGRRGHVARLGVGLLSRSRLDRRRPHQRPARARTSISLWPGAATTTTSARSRG